VGRLVVDNCLKSGHDVTAIVRNVKKANDLFSDKKITIRQLDFADLAKQPQPQQPQQPPATGSSSSSSSITEQLVKDAFDGVDQVIWCASGFVDVPNDDDTVEGDDGKKNTMKKESLDVIGMTYLLPTLSNPSMLGVDSTSSSSASNPSTSTTTTNPSFIMLSSAGVTRPSWDEAKTKKYVGCADIPIVRMNPGGILGKKVVAEDMLRQQSSNGVVPYCIVRPTGLKFDNAEWPRGRTIFSQGDVAVGRMNANDLASVLVDLLNQPSATGKTFECVTLAGYPPPTSLSPVLDRLELDTANNNDDDEEDDAVYKAYQLMQQLLPGEEQDATRLEMGRTYEQVDSGEVQGRERGAGPTEREIEIANSVVYDDGQGGETRRSFRSRIKNIFGRST